MNDIFDIDFGIEKETSSIIKVIGVGGGGGNAVNQMYKLGIHNVDFVICNTDSQALKNSPITNRIQLGKTLTSGLGAGNNPQRGREAAIEDITEIEEILENNTKMVFVTAGMGGGTGTGAAPVIAKAAKDRGILTIGVVSVPFQDEGPTRINQAIEGIKLLQENVDSVLVINNERLHEMYQDLTMSEAFGKADEVLATATKGIAEIITVHGYINVDFEDVRTVMQNSGVALMGSATAEGENRATEAIK
ncbi:MAG: cell division protein FtsZ, partial [Bacteroidales bacterium]|nr:cell division protein FtsZ [Bacteroidales bacterium]